MLTVFRNGQTTVSVATTMLNGLDDDITIDLFFEDDPNPVTSQDFPTSLEVLTYSPDGGVLEGNYCPGAPVTRAQMGVFLARTFDLVLYGP